MGLEDYLYGNENKKTVMVFSPHPDDDLIGSGGSIIKHLNHGNEVIAVYVTSGEAGSQEYTKEELREIRENEAKKVGNFLGLHEQIFLRNPDGFLEYNKKNLTRIMGLIREKKPDVVYIPHDKDGHPDHSTTSKLVLTAVGMAEGPWFQEVDGLPWHTNVVLGYEVWTPLQEVQYFEDVTDSMSSLIEALKLHKSQVKDIDYVKASVGIRSYRGVMLGKGGDTYAEAFKVYKIN